MNVRSLLPAWVVFCSGCAEGSFDDAAGERSTADLERGGSFSPPDEPGPYTVGTTSFIETMTGSRQTRVQVFYPTLEDADCDATYTITAGGVSYPIESLLCAAFDASVAPGRLPMIVYDHGGGNAGADYQRLGQLPLLEALASHGFIVVAAPHSANAVARVQDIALLIDAMLERSDDPSDPFHRRVDPNRIGVSGFSAGGTASFNLAAGHTPLGLVRDPRIRAGVFYEPGQTGISFADASTMPVPYMILGGTQFVSGVLAPDLFAATTAATPRLYVRTQDAVHYNHLTGACALIDQTREAALIAQPDIAEPLTTPSSPNPAAALAFGQWNIGETNFALLGVGFGGGRNMCERVGVDSVRSLDGDLDGFTDAPPFRITDAPFTLATAVPEEVMVPAVTLYTVAFWRTFLAGDPRYLPYLLPDYSVRHDLPSTVQIAF